MKTLNKAQKEFFEALAEPFGFNPSTVSCFQCAHHRSVPGSTHSRCVAAGNEREQALLAMTWFSDEVSLPTIDIWGNEVSVVGGNEHGIAEGWFLWPLNFDPVWLLWCLMYEEKHADEAK